MNLLSWITKRQHVIEINACTMHDKNSVVMIAASNPVVLFILVIGRFTIFEVCWYKN
jgi:hypothetical protein